MRISDWSSDVCSSDLALVAARELAAQIAAFPQRCMRADRASVYAQWDLDLADALRFEGANGYPVVFEEALVGASRFAGGAGRHGRFDSGGEDDTCFATGCPSFSFCSSDTASFAPLSEAN